MMLLLKRHIGEVQAYLQNFLTHQEIRFQQLGISAFCRLREGTSSLLGRVPSAACARQQQTGAAW